MLSIFVLWRSYAMISAQSDSLKWEAEREWAEQQRLPTSHAHAQKLLDTGTKYSNSSLTIVDSFYSRAIVMAESLTDYQILAVGFLKKGNLYYSQDRYYLALQSFIKAQEYAHRLALPYLSHSIKNGLAITYIEVERYDSAFILLKDIYQVGKSTNNLEFYRAAMVNIGWCHYKSGNMQGAICILREWELQAQKALWPEHKNTNGYLNLGYVYLDLGIPDSAAFFLQKAKSASVAAANRLSLFEVQCLLTQAYFFKNDLPKTWTSFRAIDTTLLGANLPARLNAMYYYSRYKLDSVESLPEKALQSLLKHQRWQSIAYKETSAHELIYLLEQYKTQTIILENRRLQLAKEIEVRDHIEQDKILILLGVSLLAAGLIFFGYRMYRNRKKNEVLQREIRNAQLKALKAQMNPHFLFNLLGSIEHNVVANPETACQMIGQFAKMTRKTLEMSEMFDVLLSEELAYLHHYCRLMQLKSGGIFTYTFDIDESIDPDYHRVPAMLIQPLIENAIVHGMKGKAKEGLIRVSFGPFNNRFIACKVSDNGPGMSTVPSSPGSFGKSILRTRLQLYEQMLNARLSLDFGNLLHNDDVTGFEVKLSIPCFNAPI